MDYDQFSTKGITFSIYAVTKIGRVKLGEFPVTVKNQKFTFLLPNMDMLEVIKTANRLNFSRSELFSPSFAVEKFIFGGADQEDTEGLRVWFSHYTAKDKAVADALDKLLVGH